MATQSAISKGLGKIGLVDVVVIELPDENGEVIVTVYSGCQGSIFFGIPRSPYLTDQRSPGQNVVYSVFNTEHARVVTTRPKEPAAGQQGAKDQAPAAPR